MSFCWHVGEKNITLDSNASSSDSGLDRKIKDDIENELGQIPKILHFRRYFRFNISPEVNVFLIVEAQQMMETQMMDLTNGEELDANQECTYQDEVNQMQNDYYDMNR